MRSISIPRRSHQTESLERPNKALGLAKGTPLSERMASGKPRSKKSLSKAVLAGSARGESRASHSSRKREAWSVTVIGQQYCPLPSLNSPLTSTHHRSLGAVPSDSGVPCARGRG